MGDLWIRDLSPSTHQELRRRAEQAGMSLQVYVAQLLERSVSTPTVVDWLRGLDELPRHAMCPAPTWCVLFVTSFRDRPGRRLGGRGPARALRRRQAPTSS